MATGDGQAPLEHHDVIVVGSGFAGLGMAIQLRRHGLHDFVVLERAGSVGGTWRDNHYPGCACDVPTPLYSFSFAPNPDWSHLYARHEELRAYLEACTDRFGVRAHLRLGTDVTGAAWDEARQRWVVEVDGRPRSPAARARRRLRRPEPPRAPRHPGPRGLPRARSSTPRSGTTTSTCAAGASA